MVMIEEAQKKTNQLAIIELAVFRLNQVLLMYEFSDTRYRLPKKGLSF